MNNTAVVKQQIKSVLFPIHDESLLLPVACLGEVIDYCQPQEIVSNYPWYLGRIYWRGCCIPLILFEALNNQNFRDSFKPKKNTRIAILKRSIAHSKYDFYGLVIQGSPQKMQLSKSDISFFQDADLNDDQIALTVRGIKTAIPNLEKIELALSTVFSHEEEYND